MESSLKSGVAVPVTLPVNLAGLQLKNPIMNASGTFGYGLEYAPYGDITRLGAIVTKGLSLLPKPGNPMPRIAEAAGGMLNSVGLQNNGVDYFLRQILPQLPWQQVPIIANIYADSPNNFGVLAAKLAEQPGIAALEINISCPNVSQGGSQFGLDPGLTQEITARVKANASGKPVLVKLTPNAQDIAQIAKAAQAGGADVLTCVNTLAGLGVDLESRRPLLAQTIGGLSGAPLKPVALRCVWQVRQAVDLPIIGVGGIRTARDILEFILVGASAVQVGTAILTDPHNLFNLVDALPRECEHLGLTSLDDLRGSLRV